MCHNMYLHPLEVLNKKEPFAINKLTKLDI